MKIIRLGIGEVVSNWGTSNGFPALIIEPVDEKGVVGCRAPGENSDPLHPEAIVFEIHSTPGVQILLEDIHSALLSGSFPIPQMLSVRKGRAA
jgi:hypothetical protein